MLESLISLFTLIILEAILGVDNLVFIAILSSRLPEHQQKNARRLGLLLAWVTRLAFLTGVFWIISLTKPILKIHSFALSWRDIFLIAGGLFLLVKGTKEIHTEIELAGKPQHVPKSAQFLTVIVQIALFDIVFSIDSILTAIGLTPHFWIMAVAITIAIMLMMLAAEPLTRFINRHPTIKILALSFLLLIGIILIADGCHFDIPRGYLYFAVCFSLLVEFINNLVARRKSKHL